MRVDGSAPLADVRAVIDKRMSLHRADLEALVRIPSVSAPGFDDATVRRCAEVVRHLLTTRGLRNTRLLEVEGAHPAVYGEWLGAGPNAPTVLLYAHYDVQPPGDELAWATAPFEPAERAGRLFGRGAADDKAGVLVHVAAVDAWLLAHGRLPVNVKVIVEGEEETGSEHLPAFLARYGELLQADVIVLTDAMNWRVGVPSLTYLLRGLVDCEVEVRALDHALHSGLYGGAVPDALTGLVKLLGALVDERGAPAVPGLADDARRPSPDELARIRTLHLSEEAFRADAGLLPGVELLGGGDQQLLERLWLQPAVSVIGLDAPGVVGSSNTLQPTARARVSLRIAPGQDPLRARDLLCRWLEENAPWGLEVTVTPGTAAQAYQADLGSWAFRSAERALESAYGARVVLTGMGGTIPFVQPFTEAFGGVPALLTGVEDPDTRAHGPNESLHLEDWHRACVAEALLYHELAAEWRAARE